MTIPRRTDIDHPAPAPSRGAPAAAALLAAGAAALLVAWPAAAVAAPVVALLAAAAVIDARTRRLPDVLTLPAAAIATAGYAALSLVEHGGPWLRAGTGAALFAGLLLILGLTGGGVGLGDVKAAAPAGAVLAWESWGTWFTGIITGLVLLVAAAAVHRARRGSTPRSLPYGPALVAGVLVALTLPA